VRKTVRVGPHKKAAAEMQRISAMAFSRALVGVKDRSAVGRTSSVCRHPDDRRVNAPCGHAAVIVACYPTPAKAPNEHGGELLTMLKSHSALCIVRATSAPGRFIESTMVSSETPIAVDQSAGCQRPARGGRGFAGEGLVLQQAMSSFGTLRCAGPWPARQ